VLSNVVHCTTSGAVSAWWFTTESEMFITDVEGIHIFIYIYIYIYIHIYILVY
jgi:hypothetical protein